MTDKNYTEEQINWALQKLKDKGVKELTRERAIKLLNTFEEFGKVVVDKIEEGKKGEN